MVTPPTKDPRSLLVDQKVQVCQFDSVSRQPNWHTDATFRERPPTGSMLYLQHPSAMTAAMGLSQNVKDLPTPNRQNGIRGT